MKKNIIAFLLLTALLLSFLSCGKEEQPTVTDEVTTNLTNGGGNDEPQEKPDNVFDEDNIVFTFGAISDVHIYSAEGATADKFTSALSQLEARAKKDAKGGLNAVCIAGDFLDHGHSDQTYSEAAYFKQLYESVLDPLEVPMIYCIGNHDPYGWWTKNTVIEGKNIEKKLGDDYFITDIDKEALDSLGCRHCVVNGYHILTINPVVDSPVKYDAEAKEWLDRTLKTITEEEPEKYVILLTHPMIYDTVYGSTLGEQWGTRDLTSILKNYPQVITFGGHLHFPLNDPRSIMQTDFTSVGCGAVRYMAIENGNYMDMASETTMLDRNLFSQGLLCEVDANGNMRLIRMDFYHGDDIGECWEISYPNLSGSHLDKYTKNRGKSGNNSAPVLSSIDYSFMGKVSGNIPLTVTFEAASDDEFAHDYILTITSESGEVTRLNILADFYLHAKTSDMKKTWNIKAGDFPAGTYTVALVARDSWGAESEPLTITAVLENKSDGEEDVVRTNAELELYADFDFNDGVITDTQGHVSVINKGSTVGNIKVKYNGKEYEVPGMTTKKGQYALCRFNDFDTPEEFVEFAEKGFSVEAFFSTSRVAEIQGIVCGTQNGGWGLAVNSSYHPYFITANGSLPGKYNTSVIAKSLVSATELMHVVAVYDAESLTSSIYVNGELESTEKINYYFATGEGMTFDVFMLGADTNSDTLGEFLTTGMKLVDAKIYTGVLSQSDVTEAYNNAVSSLGE